MSLGKRPDIIDRTKASSHQLAPGRIYNGKVKAVDANGRITVYVNELSSNYGNVVPLNTTPTMKYSVGDNVKCMFTDEFFKELVILGSSRITTDKFAPAANLTAIDTRLANAEVIIGSLLSTIASLQMLNASLQSTVTQLSDRVSALEIMS